MYVKQAIYEGYGLHPDELLTLGAYQAFQYRDILYTIIHLNQVEEDELNELYQMSQFLMSQGDRYISTFMPNLEGNMITESDDLKFMICRSIAAPRNEQFVIGSELAEFHQRGRMFPYEVEHSKRLGQWKSLWEKRLDQMEEFWYGRLRALPNQEVEKKFLESFPYYLGLAENAIQYLVDTEIDDLPRAVDSATICHHRFGQTTWGSQYIYKLPVDWVFDHPSRDLAEYIREQYLSSYELNPHQLHYFLSEYERINPLSSFSWRLLYARLLFPVHYFEVVEGYYSVQSEEQKQGYYKQLEAVLDHSSHYERFLKQFYQSVGISTSRYHIPEVGWLSSGV
ncbi:spore coat protein YutH [Priestia flexa]|uniref:Spore coat protein n=1 Tax=Priestia veravalensis TaxID=1414648 RepID=A0A0V8JL00_9BACI|nr:MULTISPECIES: spore coat protein YutH [Bacillaceae]KSU87612.1 spore coat protein [Priestia veravalensis]MCP1191072.1 spore coat protein YutH [Priestia flexa]MEC0667572.1 spore coat protein YutH [Priestia flexa]MED3825443.1 spore coat protein YutH [Priestia flexa]MED4588648.1 spore coat protein YutH [Priestia flexa]